MGGLLAAGLWPGALRAEGDADAGELWFLAVNDLHYRDQRCGDWFARVVKQMKGHAEKPEFLLVAGDLVQDGKPEQCAAVRDLLGGLGVPFYAVIGNHDYLKQDDRKPYEEAFADRLNYRFEHKGWQFVGLDTSEGLHYQKTSVQPATLRWLEDNAAKLDRKKPLVVLTHFPMGDKVTNRPTNADAVLERFKEHNLRAVFCGHFHGFTERTHGDATLTTNKCCAISVGNHDGTKEKGYFLCRAKDGKIERTFIEVKQA